MHENTENIICKWLVDGVKHLKQLDPSKQIEQLSDIEKQLVTSMPENYVSDWMEV